MRAYYVCQGCVTKQYFHHTSSVRAYPHTRYVCFASAACVQTLTLKTASRPAPSKVTEESKRIVEEQMQKDDETMAPCKGQRLGRDQPQKSSWNMHIRGDNGQELFAEILNKTLVPYLHNFEIHRSMQDNNPKYTSHNVADFLDLNCINWWKTPPESPDFNPIKNSWHKLKEFVHQEVKPKAKA